MSKYINSNIKNLFFNNNNYYRDWDDYDDYGGYSRPPYPPYYPPRDRYDYGPPRRSNNNWRPTYSKRDKRRREISKPKESDRFVINLFKRLTEFFLIITCLTFFVTSVCYLLIGALSDSQKNFLLNYYFIDITAMSWIFGSIAGIITGFLFFILFILQRINKRGWLRKTPLKANITWFLSFIIISLLSIYFLFVASSKEWLTKLPPLSENSNSYFTNMDVEKIYITISSQISEGANNDFMKMLINAYCNNSIGVTATGAISIGVDIFIIIVASMYFRKINDVLDDSYDYFDY